MSNLPNEFRKRGLIEPRGKKPDPNEGMKLFLVTLAGFVCMAVVMLHLYMRVNP